MAEPIILPDGVPQWSKDPEAHKDYERTWADWLGSDTIVSSTWTAPEGITIVSSEHTTTTTTVWLSGGIVKQHYRIKNKVTTAGGRIEVRSIEIVIEEK